MQKLNYLQDKKLSPVDELRALLTSLEERQVKLAKMGSTQALEVLRDLDQVNDLFNTLLETDINLLSEEGRFETIQSRIRRNAPVFLRNVGGAKALSQYRPPDTNHREQWWWYIDQIVAQRRARQRQRYLIIIAILLIIFGGTYLALTTIFAPSPEVIARVEAENQADQSVLEQEYDIALSYIQEGLVKVPNDTGLLIYQGVLAGVLSNTQLSEMSFNQAQAQTQTRPLDFFLVRSQLQLRVSRFDLAEQDARLVIEQDDANARGWLLLAQSLQSQDKIAEAISAYQTASDLAFEQGESEIVVLARFALSQLIAAPEVE